MSANTPDQPMSGRRETARRRLFDAAVTLISERGCGATTVDGIAERAGAAKGTVHYDFGGRGGLYAALMEWGAPRPADTPKEAVPAPESAAPPREALRAVPRAGVVLIGEHGSLARLLMAEAWRTGRAWYATVRQVRTEAIGVISGLLDGPAGEGLLRPGPDTGLAGPALSGMVVTVALDRRTLQPGRPVEEVRTVLAGLAGPPASPR